MPKVQTSCPRCRQPLLAEIEQLFDIGQDPEAKQRFLSGSFNLANCKSCGYQGPLSTPLVYHDPEKELLLTFFPPELGLPVNEQERLVGPMINQVVNKLPLEKRKAYLFRPQTMLSMQYMIERVLEADGITKEMIEASQKRLNLLQRLMSVSPESRVTLVQQEEALIDEEFFEMVNRLIEASLGGGDQQSARALAMMMQEILPLTATGRQIKERSDEAQAAVQSLQEASKTGLTREKLLDLMIEAPSETRLATLVGLTRSGIDYQFFQILTERIEQAEGEDKEKLGTLRETLNVMTQEIDRRVKEQLGMAKGLLEELIKAPNLEEAVQQSMPAFDEIFTEVLRSEMQLASQKGDMARLQKMQEIVTIIQDATPAPPELDLVDALLQAETEEQLQAVLNEHTEEITPDFLNFLGGLISQLEGQNQSAEVLAQLDSVYKSAMKFSMAKNLK